MKLADLMKKRKEQEAQKENNSSNFTDNLFKFNSPKQKGDSVSFKVRILPYISSNGEIKEDEVFFIEDKKHQGFKNHQGKWELNMKCPNMFGEQCPICNKTESEKALISQAWDIKEETNDDTLYKNLKAKNISIMEIYVIEYEENPEMEKQVKRIYVPKKVTDEILDIMFDEDVDVDLLSWKKGCQVKFTITKSPTSGYNEWKFKILKSFNMEKTDVKSEDVESLETIFEVFKEKTEDYEKWNENLQSILKKEMNIESEKPSYSEETKKEKFKDEESDIEDDDLDNLVDEL